MGPWEYCSARLLSGSGYPQSGASIERLDYLWAGAVHGQEMTTQELSSLIEACGRLPRQRTTLYGVPADERLAANQPPRRRPPRFVLLPVSEPI